MLTDFARLPRYALFRSLFLLGFDEPTPVQRAAVPAMLRGDVLVQAPTGSGKTGAFAVAAALAADPRSTSLQALVLSPTRELCRQTAAQLRLITGLPAAACADAADFAAVRARLRRNEVVALACTPAKLRQLARELQPRNVRCVVVDEADAVLGQPGVPAFLAQLRARCPLARFAFFSATLSEEAAALVRAQAPGAAEVRVDAEAGPPNLRQYVLAAERDGRDELLAAVLGELPFVQAAVFANSRAGAEAAHAALARRGFRAGLLHSRLPLSARVSALRRFAAGELRVLVATDVLARGVDVRSVTLVVNYELPADARAFVHRSGRTGRRGRLGRVVSFVGPGEREQVLAWCREQGWAVEEAGLQGA